MVYRSQVDLVGNSGRSMVVYEQGFVLNTYFVIHSLISGYCLQAEQALLEEEFIQACFEEMLAEEEAQWFHFPSQGLPMGQDQQTPVPTVWGFTTEQNNTEQKYNQVQKNT